MFVFMGQSFIPYLLEEARLVISDWAGYSFRRSPGKPKERKRIRL